MPPARRTSPQCVRQLFVARSKAPTFHTRVGLLLNLQRSRCVRQTDLDGTFHLSHFSYFCYLRPCFRLVQD
jgi:hypothetical protein